MITILFTVLSAIYDNGKRFENHIPRFIFRAFVVGLISLLTGTSIILNAAIFYLLFDYILNILEGRKWNYVGETAIIDRFWMKYGGWIPQLTFKIMFLLFGTYL